MSDLSTKMGELAGITNEELLGLEHELNCAKVDGKLLKQRIADLEAKNAELNKTAKKAFWWSAEFTATSHNNKILNSWEDFLSHPHAKALNDAKP